MAAFKILQHPHRILRRPQIAHLRAPVGGHRCLALFVVRLNDLKRIHKADTHERTVPPHEMNGFAERFDLLPRRDHAAELVQTAVLIQKSRIGDRIGIQVFNRNGHLVSS